MEVVEIDHSLQNDPTPFDLELMTYFKQARNDPKSMISTLKEKLEKAEKDLYSIEYQEAIQEFIDFLEITKPVSELEWQQDLMIPCK